MSARVVHKYPFPESGELVLDLPSTARVVHFGIQRRVFCVWIDRPVHATEPSRDEQLIILGTGDSTPEGDWDHVGTTVTESGTFVFHLYQGSRA